MGKTYKIIAKSESKYIVECAKCNSKFKVPSNLGKVSAKCPNCKYIHEIGQDEKPNKFDRNFSFDSIKNLFIKNGDINVKAFYIGIFVICFLVVFAKTGFKFV